MVKSIQDKARGSLMGLAVGDALGGPTEGKTREEISARWGTVMDFLSDDQIGSDDTEYALFNAKLLLDKKRVITQEDVAAAWKKEIIKSNNTYKGAGFSEVITIQNLLKGLHPPQSGQHLHSWSDGLAMRVAPFGIVSVGDPEFAAYLASVDGSISHSGEGIYSGQAVAAAIATAMSNDNLDKIISSALSVIPKDSWTYSSINRAVQIGSDAKDVWNALDPLYNSLVDSFYFWTDVAPEAVGLAFGIIKAASGKFEDAVLGSINLGRDTDTIAAISGAICGAINGINTITEKWVKRITDSKGICINTVKGMNIIKVADQLALLAQSWEKKNG